MHFSREHRLVCKTVEDIYGKDPSKAAQTQYSTRVAAANAQQQDLTHQQALAQNQSDAALQYSKDGNTAGANYYQTQADSLAQQVQSQPTNTILDQAKANTGNVYAYNPTTGQVSGAQAGAMGNPGALGINPQTPGLIDTSKLQRGFNAGVQEPQEVYEARVASIEAQNTERMKQEQIRQDSDRARSQANVQGQTASQTPTASPTGDPQAAPQDPALNTLLGMLPPGMEFLGPVLQSAYGSAGQSATNAASQYGERVGNIKESADKTEGMLQNSLNRANSQFEMVQTTLKDSLDSQNKLIATKEENDLKRLEHQQQQQTRKATADLQKLMSDMNAEIAGSGAIGSSNANNRLFEARQSGEQAINDMQAEFGFKRADVSAFYTGKTLEAHQSYVSDWTKAVDGFEARVSAVELGFIENEQEEAELLDNAAADFYAQIDKANDKQAGILEKAAAYVYEALGQEQTAERTKEQDGWKQLQWVAQTYGSNAPPGLIESIGKQLPGVDVMGILSSMTLTEANQNFDNQLALMKKGGGGGSGGGAGTFVGAGPGEATAASNFGDITPQQLREAVDRVTLSFGGTGAERNRKRGEYLDRIASGESPASIMTSMQADYWVSQKGAEKTAHDARIDSQTSAESLQSFVEFYGINGNDDGPLGRIDSRVQRVKSWFGQSSEEYNNLANNVGNIRARIIKANYGAAVTPQELGIAQSYIPDMDDKGDQFVTKIHNLKAYNAYLDAKQFAVNVGLPPPKPPVPITLTGNQVAGPGKYSPDDINSALLD